MFICKSHPIFHCCTPIFHKHIQVLSLQPALEIRNPFLYLLSTSILLQCIYFETRYKYRQNGAVFYHFHRHTIFQELSFDR